MSIVHSFDSSHLVFWFVGFAVAIKSVAGVAIIIS